MVRECVCLCLSLCVCLFVCECVCVREHALVCICVCVCVYTCVMSVCVSADDTYLGSSLNSCWALLLSSYTAVSSWWASTRSHLGKSICQTHTQYHNCHHILQYHHEGASTRSHLGKSICQTHTQLSSHGDTLHGHHSELAPGHILVSQTVTHNHHHTLWGPDGLTLDHIWVRQSVSHTQLSSHTTRSAQWASTRSQMGMSICHTHNCHHTLQGQHNGLAPGHSWASQPVIHTTVITHCSVIMS